MPRRARASLLARCQPCRLLLTAAPADARPARRVSYAPVVSGRVAWLLERAPALQWVTDLHKQTEVPLSPMRMLLSKVVVDTMVFQPTFLNVYFALTGALEGLSLAEIVEKTRASFHRAWLLSCLVWTPVQLLNLHFVPLPLQPTVVSAFTMGWQTTLSVLNHYHDHGSPRQTATTPAEPAAAPHAAPAARMPSGTLPPSGWEVERAQLRSAIARLVAENRSLRMQLGQMHANAGFAAEPSHGQPQREAAPSNRSA
jgi:hypothetical protein